VPRSGSPCVLWRAVVALTATLSAAPVVVAAGGDGPGSNPQPRFEVWTGAEAFHRVWSLYAGATYAPFGSVRRDGFRLRAVAGHGTYSYSSRRWTEAGTEALRFHGSVTFADLLAGYHKQLGRVTIKFLAGLTVADRSVDDPEADNGTHLGGKALIETWWNITDRAWTSVDLSWTTLDDVYGARARLGWRLWPALSVGVEGAATGSLDYDTARFGGFVRYEWANGELSVSSGFAGDGPGSGSAELQGPFGTINVLTRF
jgi:Cellulose biosynthesis protein BcsS